MRLTKAVADVDPASIATSAERFGQSRSYLAPVAWAAGTLVLTLRGVKLLIFNWRLLFIQLVPAAWIWIVMYDLKQHTLRGVPFADLDLRARLVIWAVAIAWSIAAFWCNTVFAYAIDGRPPPRIRPAIHRTRRHWPAILASGAVLGGMLGLAAVTIPRLDRFWLFVVCLSAVLGIMMISFVAVPARLIGRRTRKLPPREAIGRTVTGWGISAIGMTPGVLLDRLGLLMIGVPGLRVVGFLVLSLGTALYAAGMSSVKAVKLSIKLGTDDLSDTGGGPEQGAIARGARRATRSGPSDLLGRYAWAGTCQGTVVTGWSPGRAPAGRWCPTCPAGCRSGTTPAPAAPAGCPPTAARRSARSRPPPRRTSR